LKVVLRRRAGDIVLEIILPCFRHIKIMKKNYRLSAIVCALAVSLAMCFAVAAWNSPDGTPPADNVAAPINTSSAAQTKAGDLSLGHNINVTSDSASGRFCLAGECCATWEECFGGSGGCGCDSWINAGCGAGGCNADRMYQTRTCSPSGCDSETRCATDGSCGSAPCAPDCDGKECGDDGCGGECGSCSGGLTCIGGDCFDCAQACANQEATCGWISAPFGCGDNYCGDCSSGICHVNTCWPYCSELDCLEIIPGGGLDQCVIGEGGGFNDVILCF